MDDILMREYLKHKSRGMSDSEFMRKMKENFDIRYARGRGRGMRDSSYGDFYDDRDYTGMYDDFYINRHNEQGDFMDMPMGMNYGGRNEFSRMEQDSHFSEEAARFKVSQMYHTEGGRKYVGEKFDMMKAKEVCERYRGIIPQSATHADVFVAINAQYHDYCELFKAWFGDNIDNKIIESAINFWFKDDDYKGGSKVWKYFMNM